MSNGTVVLVIIGLIVAAAVYLQVSGKVDILAKLKKKPVSTSKPEDVVFPPATSVPQGFQPTVVASSAVNPFIAWKAAGYDNVQLASIAPRGNRTGTALTDQEIAQAREAGYNMTAAPVQPAPDRAGFDLGQGLGGGEVKVNPVYSGVPITYTFERVSGRPSAMIYIFGAPAAFFSNAAHAFDGDPMPPLANTIARDGIDASRLPPGRHSVTVIVDGSGSEGAQFCQ
jgi:hypothetical protein